MLLAFRLLGGEAVKLGIQRDEGLGFLAPNDKMPTLHKPSHFPGVVVFLFGGPPLDFKFSTLVVVDHSFAIPSRTCTRFWSVLFGHRTEAQEGP